MITRQGPSKLIVIRSGKYDYAELELDDSVHLVGPNNVGKTSLIALLQFLYVDDQRQMHFGRSLEETRRYYFPDSESWVLFECLTPTGFQVLGVRGLGPVKQYGFERFAYQGRFDRTDYLDDKRTPRGHDEVYRNLGRRDFQKLEPKHLRAALTGIGENKGVHLGLVPLKNREHYTRFRSVFQQLLRLSHLRQHELKALLLDIYRGEFRQREIDLERGYSDRLRRIRKDRKAVLDLQAIARDIERLLGIVDERNTLRCGLPKMWQAIGRAYTGRRAEGDRRLAGWAEELEILAAQETDLQNQSEAQRIRHRSATESRAVLEDRLLGLQKKQDRFQGFVSEFEEQRRRTLERYIADLDVRLHAAHQEPETIVRRRLKSSQAVLSRQQKLLDNLSGVAGSQLDDLLPDAENRKQLFRLLNPALLELPLGTDGVDVKARDEARKGLESLGRQLRAGRYSGRGLEITLDGVRAPDLKQFTDPDTIEQRLGELRSAIEKDEVALAALTDREALNRKRETLRSERDKLIRTLSEWDEFQQNLAESDTWRGQLKQFVEKEKECALKEREIETQRATLDLRLREVSALIRQMEEELTDLKERVGRLPAIPGHWSDTVVTADSLPTDESEKNLDDLISDYRRGREREARHDQQTQELLRLIDERTYGRLPATDEPKTFTELLQQLQALPEKEKAVQELWISLAVSLKSAFKALKQDLDSLHSQIEALNRLLGKTRISNLTRLRLLVTGRAEWLDRIDQMLETEDAPLFADSRKTEEAVERIGNLLEKQSRVSIGDLFDLSFEITTINEDVRRYDNLDTIESNGTTITIKVLVNLLLLQQLLGKDTVRIPFYLDEASSLDEDNLQAIVNHARERGFIPVLASPDPLEAAEHLYFLAEQKNGRVVLDPETSLLRVRRRQEVHPGEPAEAAAIEPTSDASPDSETE